MQIEPEIALRHVEGQPAVPRGTTISVTQSSSMLPAVMHAQTSSTRLRRRWLRAVLMLSAGAFLLLGGMTLWSLRDPGPWFAERRSALVAVEEGPVDVSAGHVSQPVRLRASSGLSVDLLVRAPDSPPEKDLAPAAEEPSVGDDPEAAGAGASSPLGGGKHGSGGRPLLLILGGYRTGEQAAMLVEDTRGTVVAAMAYPYDGPVNIEGLAVLKYVPRIRRALLDTPPAVQLALDHLLSRSDVDPTRVELVGVSFGSFFAAVAAALDQRVTRLWLIHGAGQTYTLFEHSLERSIPHRAPRAVVAAVANVLAAGPRLTPELWVPQVAPRPVIMVNALDDERLPREAVEALYASAREPKEQIWLPGQHVQPNRQEVVRHLVDVVLSRAAEPAG